MSPVAQFFDLCLFALVAGGLLSVPALFLLLGSLVMRSPESGNPRGFLLSYLLLAIPPASAAIAVAIGHRGGVAEWPPWVDWYVPAVVATNALIGAVLIWSARGARAKCTLVVVASLLLSLAFSGSATMALTGVGP